MPGENMKHGMRYIALRRRDACDPMSGAPPVHIQCQLWATVSFKPEDGVEVWAAKLRETVRDVSADINSADFGAELQIRKETFITERSLHYTV